MSLSGSSASRNSIWAMTRLASSSSMKVGRKMIRSLRSREKMSNARSPRGVCSTTIGTSAMGRLLLFTGGSIFMVPLSERCSQSFPPGTGIARGGSLWVNRRVADQEVDRLLLAQASAEGLQLSAPLHHTMEGGGRAVAGRGQLGDFRVHIGVRGGHALGLGDGLQQQGAAHGPLRPRPQVGRQLLVVPRHPV